MKALRPNPVIYEVNTLVWLAEMAGELKSDITLASVPENKWDEIARLKVDAVWLMGVWERSPECIRISNADTANVSDFRRALPDFVPEDNSGSPYAVRSYTVDTRLGGNHGLAIARDKLAARNISLILDFVPNHLAFDNPWVSAHPEMFLQGTPDDLARDPVTFKSWDSRILACGKDPYYPAWEDVVQVNAFSPALRNAVIQTLKGIASMCDGLRCDMAMLMLNDVFANTWGALAGEAPGEEYWTAVIGEVKKEFPAFTFIAEAYWDMEFILQKNGFDYCYDKRLYDRLKGEDAEPVRHHLQADAGYQSRLVRFIENHDEDRAGYVFPNPKAKAAALVSMTLPGAKLVHEGQPDGRRVRLPVFLKRRPAEPRDEAMFAFYDSLLEISHGEDFHLGQWFLCPVSGWTDNQSCLNLLAWYWKYESRVYVIAVNYCPRPSQGFIHLPECDLSGHSWRLVDLFSQDHYMRNGSEIAVSGLYVGLEAWGFHFFQMFRMV